MEDKCGKRGHVGIQFCQCKRDFLTAQIEIGKSAYSDLLQNSFREIKSMESELSAQAKALELVREALQYYANPNSPKIDAEFYPKEYKNPGLFARKALKSIDEALK